MRYRWIGLLILGAGLAAVATPSAAVPQPQDAKPADSQLHLPRWAEPISQPDYAPEPYSPAGTAGSSPPEIPAAPTQTPIDGGLSLLAAAGAGYALYRLRRRGMDDEDGEDAGAS